MNVLLRIALAIGLCIDAFVGVLSLFAQGAIAPLLDMPVKDPAVTLFAGGEFLVVAGLYALALADPKRFRPLLWLCALDQAFAIVLPLVAIAAGTLNSSPKILAPMPFQALLIGLYLAGALRGSSAGVR